MNWPLLWRRKQRRGVGDDRCSLLLLTFPEVALADSSLGRYGSGSYMTLSRYGLRPFLDLLLPDLALAVWKAVKAWLLQVGDID